MKGQGTRSVAVALAASLASLFASTASAQSQCACGYRDPSTNQVWTDAILTYFNETNAATDFVLEPTKSPSYYGSQGSGDTGSGSQDWAAYDSLNAYNEGYNSNWRTGWRYNNTYPTTDSDRATQALQLAVTAADLRNRITWGAGLVTRRRDILFGSFRTSVLPSPSSNEGTYLTMGVEYDGSDYVRTTLAASWNATLNWEWSTKENGPFNVTQILWNAIGQNWAQHNYTEHRMQWNNNEQIAFSNNGDLTNGGNPGITQQGNLPQAGGPFSFLHYSGGDFIVGQAPPEGFQLNANLLYARLFFNSSLPTRPAAFEAACAAAGGAQVCDTEDITLRGSTAFAEEAMLPQKLAKPTRETPAFAVALCIIAASIFLALLLHGLAVRAATAMGGGRGSYKRASVTNQNHSPTRGSSPGYRISDVPSDENIPLEDPRFAYGGGLLSHSQTGSFYDSVDGSEYQSEDDRSKYPGGRPKSIPNSSSTKPLLPSQHSSGGTYTWQSPRQVYSPVVDSATQFASQGFSSPLQHSDTPKSLLQTSSDGKTVEWLVLSRHADGSPRLVRPKGGKEVLLPEKVKKERALASKGLWASLKAKLFVGEGGGGKTSSGAARVEYLDGLRGFACFLVSFHHFMLIFYFSETTIGSYAHYPKFEAWFRNILGPVFTNGGLNVGIFFCLAARVIANRYLVKGKLQDLAEAIFRRVPRLMLPITAAIILNYFLIQAQAFHWVTRLISVTWSPWSYYVDYQNLGVFINAWLALWFTIPPNTPMQISTYATGILWTVPLIVQYSWTVFLCALIAKEIPNAKKRYTFYGICWLLSWYAGRFEYFFIAGLIIADLDNRLHYREKAAAGITIIPGTGIRVHGQVIAWIIFLVGAVFTWLDQIGGTGSGIFDKEYNIHPSWTTSQPNGWNPGTDVMPYTSPELFAFFFVIGFFLLCDLCTTFRTFFQLRFWSVFGRNAFSLYLLHGVIFWSWGAWLTIQLVALNVPYWAAVLVTFVTSYIMLGILCECFTRTFDNWGIGLSKSLWRECSGGLGRRV